MKKHFGGAPRNASFSAYLRTGRMGVSIPHASGIEAKFNPWHDREDGKFTFAGAGEYFGAGSAVATARMSKAPKREDAADRVLAQPGPDTRMTDAERSRRKRAAALNDPRNFTAYVVQPGDSLSRIARSRRGLGVEYLAQLNGISNPDELRAGQTVRVPTQAFLNALKADRERFARAAAYVALHDGKLPIPTQAGSDFADVDLAHLPSIEDQAAAIKHVVTVKGYTFDIDHLYRTRRVQGELRLENSEARSRRLQREAGGAHRRPTDDGGHYVSSDRFDGPTAPINLFPQNSNFNRGAYRVMEDGWVKELKAGHRVRVDIKVSYNGISTRPSSLTVTWYVDGKRKIKRFANERGGN